MPNDASALLRKGPEHVRRVEDELVAELQGNMSWRPCPTPAGFERAERDLGEGPCIDAFDAAEVVWTTDLRRPAGHGWTQLP